MRGIAGPSRGAHHQLSGAVWNIPSYLITGTAGGAAVGWVFDRWSGLELFLPGGVLAGMALAIYTIWVRYGGQATAKAARTQATPSSTSQADAGSHRPRTDEEMQ